MLSLLTSLCFVFEFIAYPFELVLRRHPLNFSVIYTVLLCGVTVFENKMYFCSVLNVVILNKPDVSNYVILLIENSFA